MLVSKPIKQTDTFAVSSVGYIVNSIQINFDELPIIFYADIFDDPILKQTPNYAQRHFFFTDNKFTFNESYSSLENIKKQIELLNMVNETFIKKFLETNKTIPEDKLIQFYIDYIYYLVDKINFLGLPNQSVIEIKYSLLLKNCELLTYINKYNVNIINNLKNLYSELSNI